MMAKYNPPKKSAKLNKFKMYRYQGAPFKTALELAFGKWK